MALTKVGPRPAFPRLSQVVKDPDLARALRAYEDKIANLELRLTDAERRLKAGGL